MPQVTDVNVREWTLQQLAPLVPKRWKLNKGNSFPDVLSAPTVLMSIQTVARAVTNPQGSWTVSYTLTIMEPDAGEKSSDALDEDLLTFLLAIEKLSAKAPVKWITATRGLAANGRNLGFDVTLEITINKE